MLAALCIRCGSVKLGAFGRCEACQGLPCADQPLAIALSAHVLTPPALASLGQLVQAIAARTPDGDVRYAALLVYLRERLPRPFHRAVPAVLEGLARAVLDGIAWPDVTVEPTRAVPLPLPKVAQRRDLFWEHALVEVRRNPALVLVGDPPCAAAPDLVVRNLATADVVGARDACLELTPGDDADPDRRRARYVLSQIELRRDDLVTIGKLVVRAHPHYLAGTRARPARVPFDTLYGALPRYIYRRRVACYLQVARFEYAGRVFALDDLVEQPTAMVVRCPASDRARR